VVIVRGDVRVDVNFELTLSVALVQAHTIAHAKGQGGFPIQIGGGFLYNTYPYVSCMYPACILKDTCIPNVS